MTLPARYRGDRRISAIEARHGRVGGEQFNAYVDAGLVGLTIGVHEDDYLGDPGAYDRAAVVRVLRPGHAKPLVRCKPVVRDRLTVIQRMGLRDPRYLRSLERRAIALRIEGVDFPVEDEVVVAAMRTVVPEISTPARLLAQVDRLRDVADNQRQGRIGSARTLGRRGPLPAHVAGRDWPPHPTGWLDLLSPAAIARVPGWYRQAREILDAVPDDDQRVVSDDELVLGLAILDLERARRGSYPADPPPDPPRGFGGRFAVTPPD